MPEEVSLADVTFLPGPPVPAQVRKDLQPGDQITVFLRLPDGSGHECAVEVRRSSGDCYSGQAVGEIPEPFLAACKATWAWPFLTFRESHVLSFRSGFRPDSTGQTIEHEIRVAQQEPIKPQVHCPAEVEWEAVLGSDGAIVCLVPRGAPLGKALRDLVNSLAPGV